MGKLVCGPLVIWEEGRGQCLPAAVVSLRGSDTPIPGDIPFSLLSRRLQVTKGHSDISSLVGHMGGEGVSRGWQTALKHTSSHRDKKLSVWRNHHRNTGKFLATDKYKHGGTQGSNLYTCPVASFNNGIICLQAPSTVPANLASSAF